MGTFCLDSRTVNEGSRLGSTLSSARASLKKPSPVE